MNAYTLPHPPESASALPGSALPWLQALRMDAAQRFAAGGFPTPREEEWRYTNVAPLEKRKFHAGPDSALPDPAWVERLRLEDGWSLVFVGGLHVPALSRTEGLPEGLYAMSLAAALEQCPERVEPHFHRIAAQESHGFVAFTTAEFQGGAYVHIPAGMVLDRPLQLLHLSTRAEGLAVLRHLVVLEPGAEAQIVETYAGPDSAAGLTATVSELHLAENAGLEHYKFQIESAKAYHFGGIYARQARASRLRQHQSAFGGLLARTEIHSDLGHGAQCELDGLFLATGRRHLDTHTLIRHLEPHAASQETYRGIGADRARGVFSGRIVVGKRAQKTDAAMSCRNLLLSEDAEIDARPQLEILADDVKCSHGVSVGQLDPQAVFFLQTRGVDELSARTMLTFAFANEMVQKIHPAGLKRLVQAELLAALPQADIREDWL